MEKKKVLRGVTVGLSIAVCVLMIAVSCLSCNIGQTEELTEEQQRYQETAIWQALLVNSEWTPQTGPTSTGETPFLEGIPLEVRITGEGPQFRASFILGDVEIEQSDFRLDGHTGVLTSSAAVEYRMTFSRNPDGTEPVMAIYFVQGTPTCYSRK
ncbi:MAG: hypothetical protein J5785_03395 [Spirochaetales bacterium]|nr:hypothetical protein [Spirochaetales bacterium]